MRLVRGEMRGLLGLFGGDGPGARLLGRSDAGIAQTIDASNSSLVVINPDFIPDIITDPCKTVTAAAPRGASRSRLSVYLTVCSGYGS